MKKIFILIAVFATFMFSCTDEEVVVKNNDLETVHKEMTKKAQDFYKSGGTIKVSLTADEVDKIILSNPELLKMAKEENFYINGIFEHNLQPRTGCGGYSTPCSVLFYYADLDNDGEVTQADIDILTNVILGIWTPQQAANMGYWKIWNVGYISCWALCSGSNCSSRSVSDIIVMRCLAYQDGLDPYDICD